MEISAGVNKVLITVSPVPGLATMDLGRPPAVAASWYRVKRGHAPWGMHSTADRVWWEDGLAGSAPRRNHSAVLHRG
jgi:hypothetical protein